MDEMTSTEFRRRYATLTAPVIVTVNGHVIGQWVPVGSALVFADGDEIRLERYEPDVARSNAAFDARFGTPSERAARRFNSQPFTPVPKK